MIGAQLGAVFIAALVLLLVLNTRRPPAIDIDVHDGLLTVRLHGWDALYCCRRQLSVPLSSVDGVCVARREDVPAEAFGSPAPASRASSAPGPTAAGISATSGTYDAARRCSSSS